jgi:predicted DNA-binding transcriptional regulator AlpA
MATDEGTHATTDTVVPPTPEAPVEKLVYRYNELASALGVSVRTLQRKKSAGQLLPPTMKIGRMPIWSREAVKDWLSRGGV